MNPGPTNLTHEAQSRIIGTLHGIYSKMAATLYIKD